MKRILSLLFASLLLVSAVGCSPAQQSAPEPDVFQENPSPEVNPLSNYTLAEAIYPQMAPYPDETKYINEATGEYDDDGFMKVYDAWRTDQRARRQQEVYTDSVAAFIRKSISQFLSGTAAENRVYSPPNVYLALAMLAELTDGNSRQQVLDLLSCDTIDTLRTQASALWTANYCADGATTTLLASSLWLDEDISFKQATMDTLADIYHASSYRGQMGSKEFDQALCSWLNEQTGGLLQEQAEQIELDAETILALASTIYFRAKWTDEFSEEKTEPKTFHTVSGDIICDFMHQGGSDTYYWGERFSAVTKRFEGGEAMWFILPDEAYAPEVLLEDQQVMDFLLQRDEWQNSKFLIVNKSIPKFDITSQLNLQDGLKALGVTDIFDYSISDFSPMTDDTDEIYLSQAKHDARVTIDEEGCTAAAYTVMATCGAAMPPEEEVDFVLDRPFLFAITGYDGLPLFVGVVHQPIAK